MSYTVGTADHCTHVLAGPLLINGILIFVWNIYLLQWSYSHLAEVRQSPERAMFDQQWPLAGLGGHLVDGHRPFPLHGSSVIFILAAFGRGMDDDGVGKSEILSECVGGSSSQNVHWFPTNSTQTKSSSRCICSR